MTSQREQALEALRHVLMATPGVRQVKRQALKKELLSAHEIPGIVVDELTDRLNWEERHNGRTMGVQAIVGLDCQVQATNGNVSTSREALKWAVVNALANNPQLITQLAGEDQAQPHAMDCASHFEVRYIDEPYPYGRVLITIILQLEETFDDREVMEWSTLMLETSTDASQENPIISTHTKE